MKLSQFLRSPNARSLVQLFKFGVVGLSNTAISYGVELLCYYVLFAQVGWPESVKILVTSVLAFVISVTNSYFWNNRYVFGSGEKKTLRQHLAVYLRTAACYALTGLVLAPAFKLWLSGLSVPYWLASIVSLVFTIPLNFLLNKFWAFHTGKPGEKAPDQASRQAGWRLTALLALSVLAFSLLYFNNTFPITEGWGVSYVELMFQGKVPYRDFYYYLPPLNLWMDSLFWRLSFGRLLAFRGWYLLQRIVLYVLLFRMLRQCFPQRHAFFACVLTSFLAASDSYDLLGDYNQTTALLAVLLTYCALAFARSEDLRGQLKRLWLAGLVLGCMFLNKQTIFLASFLVFFVALALLCILNRDKRFWSYCLSVAGGMILPVGLAFLYLAANGALIPFLEQVFFHVDGKGSLFQIIVTSLARHLTWKRVWLVILLLAVAVAPREIKLGRVDLKFLLLALALLVGLSTMPALVTVLRKFLSRYPAVAAAALACAGGGAVVLYFRRDRLPQAETMEMAAMGLVLFCLCATYIGCLLSCEFAQVVYSEDLSALVHAPISQYLLTGSVALFFPLFFQCRKNVPPERRSRCQQLLFLNCGGFSLLYAGFMSCGMSALPAYSLRLILPFMLCLVLSVHTEPAAVRWGIKGAVIALCLVTAMTCMGQKVIFPYSWWGTSMPPRDQRVYTTDIPALAGIRLSAEQKELYESVTDLIEENTPEDAVILGYPHIKLFHILTGRYRLDTFVPVLFYDVTADVYVERETELLKDHLPDVIIWQDIPYCKETHEYAFRNGEPLKQRELEALLDQVIPERYTWMESIQSVSVYIRNDTLAAKNQYEKQGGRP